MFFVLLARVKAFISRHKLIIPGQTLAVGVSGGPDSIALLHLLTRLRADYDLKLIACHLDHGLRPDSGREAEFVARTAGAWGVDSVIERADVPALARTGHLSVEEAGRAARYEFFARAAEAVAVAHHADDQVETVLMHFLRGSGIAGLRGMLPKTMHNNLVVIRPLLPIPRPDIETYLAEHKLDFVVDPTNADQTFFRNRLRHELIPFLETYNPNIRQILNRTAEVMTGDYELLRGLVEKAWAETILAPRSNDLPHRGASRSRYYKDITFDLRRWRSLPLPLQRALLREAIHRLNPNERNADFTPIDGVARWTQTADSGHTADLLGGLCVSVVGEELRVGPWEQLQTSREAVKFQITSYQLPITGKATFLGHHFAVTLLDTFSLADIEANPDPFTAYLDADLAPFTLRTRRPGDRFQPLGMTGATKLSDFMINKKVPVDQRDSWPLLCCGVDAEIVLWVPGYAIAEQGRVTEGMSRVVRVSRQRV